METLGDLVVDLPSSTGVSRPGDWKPTSPCIVVSSFERVLYVYRIHFGPCAIDGTFTHAPGNQNPPSLPRRQINSRLFVLSTELTRPQLIPGAGKGTARNRTEGL